jgi:hypothetical protein
VLNDTMRDMVTKVTTDMTAQVSAALAQRDAAVAELQALQRAQRQAAKAPPPVAAVRRKQYQVRGVPLEELYALASEQCRRVVALERVCSVARQGAALRTARLVARWHREAQCSGQRERRAAPPRRPTQGGIGKEGTGRGDAHAQESGRDGRQRRWPLEPLADDGLEWRHFQLQLAMQARRREAGQEEVAPLSLPCPYPAPTLTPDP